ncbi:MAG: hypothetical protein AABW82_00565 [Nanoarchaeota archaeon]
MAKIFSEDYYYAGQVRFEKALEAGRLDVALSELERFVMPRTHFENIGYQTTLAEGYRALANAYLKRTAELSTLDVRLKRRKRRKD